MAVTPLNADRLLADTFEPKRQNRWILFFGNEEIPAFTLKTVSRPSFTMEPIVIDYINSKRYLAGKGEWGTIAMTLHDPIAPSSSQRVMEWVRLSHETISGRDGYAAFYKKDFSLEMLDPVGASVEKWDVRGAFISEATFGDLSYDSAEPAEISVTIRMDECILRY
jgi:hypothetical protein